MSPLTRISSNIHLLASCRSGPLYIPEQKRHVIKTLESGGPRGFIDELERLSALGSTWASATLGYLYLLPGPGGKRAPDRAIKLCEAGAAAGDPYALFVLAWALLLKGQRILAISTMKMAALSKFPPAELDYVTFVWNGWGTKEVYSSAALKLLRRADKAHHKAALIWRCKLYSSGKFGALYACLGYIVLPFARLRYLLAGVWDPFSCRVFSFATWVKESRFQLEDDQHS